MQHIGIISFDMMVDKTYQLIYNTSIFPPGNDVAESTQDEVADFLKKFKELAEAEGVFVANRRKNNEALSSLSITKKLQQEEFLSLSVSDYSSGPEPDHARDGEVWIFGKDILGTEVYMKLKLEKFGSEYRMARCLSFHPADYRLDYPYKE